MGVLGKYNPDTFQNELQKMVNSLNETLKSRSYKPSVILADYCPWLQNFHGAEMDMRLEIPGQYTGHKKPLVQHHITISGFHSKVFWSNFICASISILVLDKIYDLIA